MDLRIGIIGSGSWATAIAKILTDKKHKVNWWIRNSATIDHIQKRHHNPHYLSSVYFDVSQHSMSSDL
jgi:glycerol-3-phosphate dehydrogenase (NAD(P)+)